MKKFLLGTALAVMAASQALAADFPVKAAAVPMARPIYDWTGLYVGINAGGGQSGNCWGMNGYNVPVFAPGGKSTFIGVSGATSIAEGCNDNTGAIVGGQIGYRYQLNNFVFGIEAQGDWADLNGSFASTALGGINAALSKTRAGGAASLTNTTNTDAIGMFTGQVGYSFGPVLWYLKGGAAITDNKYSGVAAASLGTASVTLTDAGSALRFGEVVGTGVDWMFADGWSVGFEYSHLFMRDENVGLAYTGNTVTGIKGFTATSIAGIPSRNENISGDIDMATVRLNYKFTSH